MKDFEALGLSTQTLKPLGALGITTPTPIQAKAIPAVLSGRDVMGLAQTGTGKTAAFGLPLVHHLQAMAGRPAPKTTKALIVAPTRELVNQIAVHLRGYVKGSPTRVNVVVGGMSIQAQVKRLAGGSDIVVATPGRLLDLVKRQALRLDSARFLVLDEADQMLDLGFIHALREISRLVGTQRQTMLFSATMSNQIAQIADAFLTDPVRIEVAPSGMAADKIDQQVHFADTGAKAALLESLLAAEKDALSLVFSRTKHGAEKLMKRLSAAGFAAGSIHGNKSQGQRDRVLKSFREGDVRVLVATDVAARGIDIPGVTHVYNYELPQVAESYVHRIGRTARAGASGKAVALCAPTEVPLLEAIEKLMGRTVETAGGERPAEQRRGHSPKRGAQKANGKGRGRSRRRAGWRPRVTEAA